MRTTTGNRRVISSRQTNDATVIALDAGDGAQTLEILVPAVDGLRGQTLTMSMDHAGDLLDALTRLLDR